MSRKLVVEVVADTSKLRRGFSDAQKATGQLGGQMGQLKVGFGTIAKGTLGVIGVASALDVLKETASDAVEASSNLAEQTSKTNAVFGQSAQAVEDWSKTSVSALGLASDQALETASSIGALLRPIGISGSAAAEQSEKITQLGTDLASFYNTDVASALDALRSGIVGESEPLRKYGVQLSEARVQAEAMAETGKKTASELTNQDKVLARLAIIYKDTNIAQGDFARTSSGLANQQRILQANIRQLEIGIGTALLPTIKNIVSSLNRWLSNSENQKKVTDAVEGAVRVLTGTLRALKGVLDTVNSITGSTTNTVKLFVAAWGAFKVTRLIQNLGILAGAQGIAGVGSAAETAGGKVGGLKGALGGLSGLRMLPITIPIVYAVSQIGAEQGGRLIQATGGSRSTAQLLKDFMTGTAEKFWMVGPKAAVHLIDIAKGRADQFEPMAEETKKAADAVKKTVVQTHDFSDALQEHIAAQNAVGDKLKEAVRKGPSQALVNQWFDNNIARLLSRAEAIGMSIPEQIAKLREVKGLIETRAKATKDVTRQLSLENQAWEVGQTILEKQAEQQADAAQAAADAKQARQEAIQKTLDALTFGVERAEWTTTINDNIQAQKAYVAALKDLVGNADAPADLMEQIARADHDLTVLVRTKATTEATKLHDALQAYGKTVDNLTDAWTRTQEKQRRREVAQRKATETRAKRREQARQFGILGLGPTGEERVPEVEALQRRLKQIRATLEGTEFDTPKVRGRLAGIAKMFRQGIRDPLHHKVTPETRRAVDEYFDSITKASDKGTKKFVGFQHFSSRRIAKAFHLTELTGPELRRARAAIRFAAGGGPKGASAAFAGAGGRAVHVGTVNVYNTHKVGDLENELTKRQASRPHHRRGSR